MSDFPTPKHSPDSEEAFEITKSVDEPEPSKERRHALKAGLLTPVILSILSQPALGSGGTCFTPSRSLSRNTSLTQKNHIGTCNGLSPGNYKTQVGGSAGHWPISPCTTFHSVFVMGPYGTFTTTNPFPQGCPHSSQQGSTRSLTMLEVLNLNGTQDPSMVAFHIVGAYLNILNHYVSSNALTVQSLKDIWSEYAQSGKYQPVAGVYWYGSDIVNYLSTNFIAP